MYLSRYSRTDLILILDFRRRMNIVFLVLGFLQRVRGEFTDDVSETDHESEDTTHNGFRNVVGKFTSHTV